MKILITGHKGFVGKHFVSRLEKDNEIVGLDIKDGLEFDCRNFFREQCQSSNPQHFDLVIHLAAIVGGRETIENEPLSVATDLSVDSEMFNWALKTHQGKIIYYSSSAAYPTKLQERGKKLRLREEWLDLNDVHNPDFTYGWTKLTGEMLANFARKQGLNVYVFRPFSGYGEDQDLTYPFPSFIRRFEEKADPFVIWGDGKQVRDFIHIEDIVSATLKAVELDIQKPINLGLGRPTDFNELAQIIFKIGGWRPKQIHRLIDKPVGVDYRCSDNSFMLTFYKPQITLEEGIERALKAKRDYSV